MAVLLLLVGCLTSQQHAGVSQERTCPDNFRCCDTNIEVVDQASYLTQSQNTATRPILCCHIEIEVVDQALYLTHNILTPGQPVPALTLQCQAAGRVATRIPGLKSLVGFSEKSLTGRAGFDLQSATIEADAKPLGWSLVASLCCV